MLCIVYLPQQQREGVEVVRDVDQCGCAKELMPDASCWHQTRTGRHLGWPVSGFPDVC